MEEEGGRQDWGREGRAKNGEKFANLLRSPDFAIAFAYVCTALMTCSQLLQYEVSRSLGKAFPAIQKESLLSFFEVTYGCRLSSSSSSPAAPSFTQVYLSWQRRPPPELSQGTAGRGKGDSK